MKSILGLRLGTFPLYKLVIVAMLCVYFFKIVLLNSFFYPLYRSSELIKLNLENGFPFNFSLFSLFPTDKIIFFFSFCFLISIFYFLFSPRFERYALIVIYIVIFNVIQFLLPFNGGWDNYLAVFLFWLIILPRTDDSKGILQKSFSNRKIFTPFNLFLIQIGLIYFSSFIDLISKQYQTKKI